MSNYISLYNETDINATNLTIDGDVDLSDANVIVGTIKFADGSVSNPSITYVNEPTLGLYRKTNQTISFASNNVDVLDISSGSVTSNVTLKCPSLEATGTIIGNDIQGETLLIVNDSTVGSLTSGTISCTGLTSTGPILIENGSNTQCALAFSSSNNTGIYRSTVATVAVSSNGTEVASFNTSKSQFFETVDTNGNQLNCGNINSSGTFTNGTNSMTTGSLSCTSLTSTGPIIIPIGSASQPSLSFSNSTNSGIYETSVGTIAFASSGFQYATFNSSIINLNTQVTTNNNTLSCGPLSVNGIMSNGTSAMTTGAVHCTSMTSSGTMSCGTNSLTCGALTSGAITSSGTFSCGTNSLTCGSIISSGTISSGTNSLTTGAITSSGTFSNGTNSLTCGSIISSGSFSNGTNSLTCGAITSSGTFSNGTNSMTTGAITSSGAFTNGTNSMTTGNLIVGTTSSSTNCSSKSQIYGTINSASNSGCVTTYLTTQDAFPNTQLFCGGHNNIYMGFDYYLDTTSSGKSGSATSNFVLSKNNDNFVLYFSNSNAQGASVPLLSAIQWDKNGSMYQSYPIVIGNSSKNTNPQDILQLYGNQNSANAPSISAITSQDAYPCFHMLNSAHGNIAMSFDAYYDGTTYRSSNSTCNYQLSMAGNQLRILYGSGTAQGSVLPLTIGAFMDLNGNWTNNNNLSVGGYFSSSGQAYLSVNSSTNQSYTSGANTDYANWDTVIDNQGGITITSGTTFTIPTAGVYSIMVSMTYATNATGQRGIWILFGGTRYGSILIDACSAGATEVSTSAIIKFSASNTFTIRCTQNSGGALLLGTNSASIPARVSIIKQI